MTADELRKRFPRASTGFLQANADGVCAADAQPVEGHPLERPAPGKKKGSSGLDGGADVGRHAGARRAIAYRVFAVRPADFDAYHIKELQDLLCHAGALAGDAWDKLEGRVISEKVHTQAEERTEITIEQVT